MELVPALAPRLDEPGVDQHVEVLGDGLPRRRDGVLDREPRTQLEQGLVVPLGQLVEDRSSCGVRQGLEDVAHTARIGKLLLACQHHPLPGPTFPAAHRIALPIASPGEGSLGYGVFGRQIPNRFPSGSRRCANSIPPLSVKGIATVAPSRSAWSSAPWTFSTRT